MFPFIILLFGFIISFLLTIFIIPNLILLAESKQLFDLPDQRKIHTTSISSLGGIAFFITFWAISIGVSDWTFLKELRFLFLGSFILFLVSLKDDLIGISPVKRLIVQFLIGILCYSSGFIVKGFYGLFGIEELSFWLNFPLTLLTISLIINAYNLIDGINGLAGSLGLLATLIFGLFFWCQGNFQWCLTALITAGSIMGFLKFNFGKATIFMGDNGSTFIGLLVAVFFIQFINTDYFSPYPGMTLMFAISIIFIPVFDLIRVFSVRLFKGNSPLKPDKSHLHHFLLNLGKSHGWICFFILGMQLLACLMGIYFIKQFGLTSSLLITVLLELFIVVCIVGSLQITKIKKMEQERRVLSYLE